MGVRQVDPCWRAGGRDPGTVVAGGAEGGELDRGIVVGGFGSLDLAGSVEGRKGGGGELTCMVKLSRPMNLIGWTIQAGAARVRVTKRRSEVIMEVCILDRCLGLWRENSNDEGATGQSYILIPLCLGAPRPQAHTPDDSINFSIPCLHHVVQINQILASWVF